MNRYSPNKYFFYEKINVILCSADKKDLSAFCFLTSSGKITNWINMSNSMSVHLLLTQAIPGDSGAAVFFFPLYILFSELTHGNLKDWNSKTSKLPLCVGSIFHWHQNVTSTFIIGLDNKPPSRGLLLSGGFSVAIMSGYNSATWENLAPLHGRFFFSKLLSKW